MVSINPFYLEVNSGITLVFLYIKELQRKASVFLLYIVQSRLVIGTLTLLFLWAFLRFLVVTDIDSITKNWKHTNLILLLRAHDKVSIFVFD